MVFASHSKYYIISIIQIINVLMTCQTLKTSDLCYRISISIKKQLALYQYTIPFINVNADDIYCHIL